MIQELPRTIEASGLFKSMVKRVPTPTVMIRKPRHTEPPLIMTLHVDLSGCWTSTTEMIDVSKRGVARRRTNERRLWVENLARHLWVIRNLQGRCIDTGDITVSYDKAAEYYVLLKRLLGEEFKLNDDVSLKPDYWLCKEERCCKVGISLYVSTIAMFRVDGVAVTDDMIVFKDSPTNPKTIISILHEFTPEERQRVDSLLQAMDYLDPLKLDSWEYLDATL